MAMNPFDKSGQSKPPSNVNPFRPPTTGTPKPEQPETKAKPEAETKQSAAEQDLTEAPHEAEVLDFRPKPVEEYLDRNVDLETLQIPLTRFPGVKRTIPDAELVCEGWRELIAEIAPSPAPAIAEKKYVPYYIAGTLKEAEFVGKTREQALKKERPTFGKQRSSKHITSLGPAMLLDDDGNVLAREARLGALGAAAILYTSHSYGFVKEGKKEPSQGGRTVLLGNRQWSPDEHSLLWDGIEHLLGGGFDEHSRSAALCYGRHARRSEGAPYKCVVIEGAVLDVDAVIAARYDHNTTTPGFKKQSKGTNELGPKNLNASSSWALCDRPKASATHRAPTPSG